MKRNLQRGILALLATVMMAGNVIPTYAAAKSNELVADYKNGKYMLNMAHDEFFNIPNLEFGEKYTRTMEVRNEGNSNLTVSMIDVKNNLKDNRLYDNSNLDIVIDGKTVYAGAMNDARWSEVLGPGKSLDVEYTYYVTEPDHIPDNSWMYRDMDATYVFVGEWTNPSSGDENGHYSGVVDGYHRVGTEESSSSISSSESSDETTTDSDSESGADVTVIIPRNPQTGDSSHMVVYGVIFGLCATGLIACVVVDGKNRKKKE